MMKTGPCMHCGIHSTPLWRNGPTEKPVLCNACGSHFKARGTLENYLPRIVQQAQLLELSNQEQCEHNVQLNIDEAASEKGFEFSSSSSSGDGDIDTDGGVPERTTQSI
ncbi:GATA transcription factor [Trifolium repens]|nr:GATA transcription factor [Trifolium repens]